MYLPSDLPTITKVKQLADSDFGICICQTDKEENVSTPKRESFLKLIRAIDERTKYRDTSYRDFTRRFIGINVENLKYWTRFIINNVTRKLQTWRRLKARFEKKKRKKVEEESKNKLKTILRESLEILFCILTTLYVFFCQSIEDGESVYQISIFNRSEQFRKALWYPCNEEVKIRCMTAHDPIAAEIKYHKRCWRKSVDRINESSQMQTEANHPYYYESVFFCSQ